MFNIMLGVSELKVISRYSVSKRLILPLGKYNIPT